MKYCSKCGNGNSDESVFCASCGTPLQQAPTAPQEQPAVSEQPVPADSTYNTQPGTYFTDTNNQAQANYSQPAAGTTEKNPNILWLILNIVITVCCCSPLGIVGIVFAAIGMGSFNKGDFEDSKKKSKLAMIMFVIGIALGIVTWIVIFATGALANSSYFSNFGY